MQIAHIPTISVCLHRSLRWILLIHRAHTVDSDGTFRGELPFGEEQKFGLREFQQDGLAAIRESFSAFSSRVGIPDSEVGSFSMKKWQAILKDHRMVGIDADDSGLWHFSPQYSRRPGCVSSARNGDATLWDPTSGNDLFLRTLWFAFGAAELPKRRTPGQLPQPTLMPRDA